MLNVDNASLSYSYSTGTSLIITTVSEWSSGIDSSSDYSAGKFLCSKLVGRRPPFRDWGLLSRLTPLKGLVELQMLLDILSFCESAIDSDRSALSVGSSFLRVCLRRFRSSTRFYLVCVSLSIWLVTICRRNLVKLSIFISFTCKLSCTVYLSSRELPNVEESSKGSSSSCSCSIFIYFVY